MGERGEEEKKSNIMNYKCCFLLFVISLFMARFVFNNNDNEKILTTFWTDENIAYWYNFNPTNGRNKTPCEINLRQYAQLNAAKCIPRDIIITVKDLIIEEIKRKRGEPNDEYWLSILGAIKPPEKQVVSRCSSLNSYCGGDQGLKCLPTLKKNKLTVVLLNNNNQMMKNKFYEKEIEVNNNNTLGIVKEKGEFYFKFYDQVHLKCDCQCPL